MIKGGQTKNIGGVKLEFQKFLNPSNPQESFLTRKKKFDLEKCPDKASFIEVSLKVTCINANAVSEGMSDFGEGESGISAV